MQHKKIKNTLAREIFHSWIDQFVYRLLNRLQKREIKLYKQYYRLYWIAR